MGTRVDLPKMPWTVRAAGYMAVAFCIVAFGLAIWAGTVSILFGVFVFVSSLPVCGMAIGIRKGAGIGRKLAIVFAVAAALMCYADFHIRDFTLLPIVAMAVLLYLPPSNRWFAQCATMHCAAQGRCMSRIAKAFLSMVFLLMLLVTLVFAIYSAFGIGGPFANMRFSKMSEKADRIVIRKGGYNCCQKNVDGQEILYVITNASEIAEFNSLFKFRGGGSENFCKCCGYPGIDWWCGDKKLALTALKHKCSLWWEGIGGVAPLTIESIIKVQEWFARHGIDLDSTM